jgi:hypothetical protein
MKLSEVIAVCLLCVIIGTGISQALMQTSILQRNITLLKRDLERDRFVAGYFLVHCAASETGHVDYDELWGETARKVTGCPEIQLELAGSNVYRIVWQNNMGVICVYSVPGEEIDETFRLH